MELLISEQASKKGNMSLKLGSFDGMILAWLTYP
jgi:hypothetical protein